MIAEAASAPITVHRPLAAEDAARANFYALLARLLAGGPDDALLANLAAAQPLSADGDAAMRDAWQALVDASADADADEVSQEYDDLFVGVGKAPVSIYAGFHGGAPAVDHPRVRMQADLAALGLARREPATEPEDHYAVIFDTMRVLVAGGAGREPAPLAAQKGFFDRHVRPGADRFFSAVGEAAEANYYRRVAALGAAFVALETQSFQLD
ncbi:MAG TPA: molecular chaperone TorD family protein [Usitatibacter sp.]|nr:molecular chaperone TorD family protein [Usitatibacter sp.]